MAEEKPENIASTVVKGRIYPVKPPLYGRDWIEFPKHATDQMKLRDISQEDVIKTIRSPTAKGLPTQADRERFHSMEQVSASIN